jgi:hypothetical protein
MSDNDNFERSFPFNSFHSRGFGISVPFIWNCLIKYHLIDGSCAGFSIHGYLGIFAVLSSNDVFFAVVLESVNEGGECFVIGTRSFTNNRLEPYRLQNMTIGFSAFLFVA